MAVPQIAIRLTATSKAEFERYAEKLGLDASALIRLLIVRERHQRRIAKLARKGTSSRSRRAAGSRESLPKVTAHFSSAAEVAEFDDYAKECGLNRNGAGAWLVQTELSERWLEKAIRAKTV